MSYSTPLTPQQKALQTILQIFTPLLTTTSSWYDFQVNMDLMLLHIKHINEGYDEEEETQTLLNMSPS